MIAQFIDSAVDLTQVGPGVMMPTSWKGEASQYPDLFTAATDLASAISQATDTPWIISSASTSLAGEARTESGSHMQHIAIDIAPMYSDDVILPEDPPLSCLAMNWQFLRLLAPSLLACRYVAVVEGDHIHILLVDKPDLCTAAVLAVPTISTAYHLSKAVSQAPVPLLFNPSTMTLGPTIEVLGQDVSGDQLLRDIAAIQDNALD